MAFYIVLAIITRRTSD